MKAGPETHSTCTGNQVPRYQARSQGMIWCWNPVIDVEDVLILTNDVIEDGDVAMQLWCYSWCSNKTNDFTYDVMFWSRPTKAQTMMLRYQSTMLNSDQLCYRRQWYLNLINDVTHDNDDSILFNNATDNDNVLITSPGPENANKVQRH